MDALFPTGKRLTLILVKGSYNWVFLSCSLVLKKMDHFIYLAYHLGMLYRLTKVFCKVKPIKVLMEE